MCDGAQTPLPTRVKFTGSVFNYGVQFPTRGFLSCDLRSVPPVGFSSTRFLTKVNPMNPAERPTVMVADSHEDTRRLLKFWLEAEGYRVVEAADGREALELTKGECPDLIMMSTRMPVFGGLEVARLIREGGKECAFPIVALSTFPTTRERALAIAAGCDEFVSMPAPLRSLSKIVGRLLTQPGRQQAQSG